LLNDEQEPDYLILNLKRARGYYDMGQAEI
jgi:hypothetical protein